MLGTEAYRPEAVLLEGRVLIVDGFGQVRMQAQALPPGFKRQRAQFAGRYRVQWRGRRDDDPSHGVGRRVVEVRDQALDVAQIAF
jgi:hypothetical protein